MKKYLGGLLFFIVVAAAASGWATDGHQLTGIGALQTGTGGAGVASAKDSTWVLLNPASIVTLDRRLDFSLELFAPERYLEPDGPLYLPMANRSAGKMSDDSVFYIPAMGAVFPYGDDVFGFGLFAVNGMGVDYAHSRTTIPGIFGKNFDRRTKYGVMKAAVAYAHDFGDGWSLGATLTLDYARFQTDMLTLGFWETKGQYHVGNTLGGGLTLGVRKAWDRLSLGAAYTTPQWMQRFDTYKDLLPLPLDVPQMAQAGLAYKIRPNLEYALDYKYINWAGVEQIGKSPIDGGFGWHDQHVIKTGITWDVNPKWTLRAGSSYGNSPIHAADAFANGLFPAIVEAHAMGGVTYAISDKSDIHFTYEHAFGKTLTDNGKGDLFSLAGRGTKIHLEEDTFTVQYSYKF